MHGALEGCGPTHGLEVSRWSGKGKVSAVGGIGSDLIRRFQKVEVIERTTRRMAGSTITPLLIFAKFRWFRGSPSSVLGERELKLRDREGYAMH